jgi:hypothetical protein
MRIALIVLVAALAACATKSSSLVGATGVSVSSKPDTCAERLSEAQRQVAAAIESARACQVDADCATVEVSTGCFHACTQAVADAKVAAVKAAIQSANESSCASFVDDGCRVDRATCAPRGPARCVVGACQ